MMVKGPVPDVEHKAVKIFRHLIAAQNGDVRAAQLQQCGAENVVRMKFSTVGKGFFGKLQGILAPFSHKIQYI